MTTATITQTATTTTTNNHKPELLDWFREFSEDYFRGGKATAIINSAAYRATRTSVDPEGIARSVKELATTKTLKSGQKKTRTSMGKNAPTWSQRANTFKRHVPSQTVYNDAQHIASEMWGYLTEFVNLVQFQDDGTWSLEWKRSKRSKRIFRRSGNLGNLHRVLIWAGISAAINEKKSQDIKNSELRSYDSDESLELVANETLHSLDFGTITETIFKPVPVIGSKEQRRIAIIENKRREDKRAKLSRQLNQIVEKKMEGTPLTSGERVLLFRLKDMVPQESFEEILCRVENVKMSCVAFDRPRVQEEYGPWEQSFWFAYMRTPCPMYLVK